MGGGDAPAARHLRHLARRARRRPAGGLDDQAGPYHSLAHRTAAGLSAMKIREVNIAGYRSLRAIRFPVGQLTVFVGANGVGKTNLYRALQLLQASAAGTLARELASEGGMESALWAGKRKVNKPARIKLSV